MSAWPKKPITMAKLELDPGYILIKRWCERNEKPLYPERILARCFFETRTLFKRTFSEAARLNLCPLRDEQKLHTDDLLSIYTEMFIVNDTRAPIHVLGYCEDAKAWRYVDFVTGEERTTKDLSKLSPGIEHHRVFMTPEPEPKPEPIDVETARKGARRLFKSLNNNKDGRWFFGRLRTSSSWVAAFGFTVPLFIMMVYRHAEPIGSLSRIAVFAVIAGCLLLIEYVVRLYRARLSNEYLADLDVRFSHWLYDRLLYARTKVTKDVLHDYNGRRAHIFREFERVKDHHYTLAVFKSSDAVIIGAYVLFFALIGKWLLLIPLVILGVLGLAVYRLRKASHHAMLVKLNKERVTQSLLVVLMESFQTIKTFGMEADFLAEWIENMDEQLEASSEYDLAAALVGDYLNAAQVGATFFVAVFGVVLTFTNAIQPGHLVACLMITGRMMAIGPMLNLWFRRPEMDELEKELVAFGTQPQERRRKEVLTDNYGIFDELDGALAVKDVSFEYPALELPKALLDKGPCFVAKMDVDDDWRMPGYEPFQEPRPVTVFEDLNISLKPGSQTSLIGENGAGKTTLFLLIMDIYRTDSGTIHYGIYPRAFMPLSALRYYIHHLRDEEYWFEGSVFSNLSASAPKASEEYMECMIKELDMEHLLLSHPDRLQRKIGERGAGLSVIEKNALSLVRATLSEAKVWLLDEPLLHLDNRAAERHLKLALEIAKERGVTVFMATHRHVFVALTEQIVALENNQASLPIPLNEGLEHYQDWLTH